MKKKLNLLIIFLLGICLYAVAGNVRLAAAVSPPTTPIIDPAPTTEDDDINSTTITLYDGSLNSLPAAQGSFIYLTDPLFGASATQETNNGATILDSTPVTSDKAGYFHFGDSPTLVRADGFRLETIIQIEAENHNNNDRAGFSTILLSSDAKGVEMGFWEDEVWTQNDDPIFTHGEGLPFDTSQTSNTYTLEIIDDSYRLMVADEMPLSGSIRDYTSFGFPYTSTNFIFLGDDTSSAAARMRLTAVTITTNTCSEHNTQAPTLTAVADSNDLELTWVDVPANLDYTIYRDTNPYFVPNAVTLLAEKKVLSHTDGNVTGGGNNYFYFVHEAHCNHNSSQQIGLFKFPIITAG